LVFEPRPLPKMTGKGCRFFRGDKGEQCWRGLEKRAKKVQCRRRITRKSDCSLSGRTNAARKTLTFTSYTYTTQGALRPSPDLSAIKKKITVRSHGGGSVRVCGMIQITRTRSVTERWILLSTRGRIFFASKKLKDWFLG